MSGLRAVLTKVMAGAATAAILMLLTAGGTVVRAAAPAARPAQTAPAETVLRRGLVADPLTLDPHKASVWSEFHVIHDLWEGLVALGPKGEIIPGAAASWSISPDGQTYSFHLRAGIEWSNGEPLSADDFVYSLRRALNAATAAPFAYLLFPIRHADEVLAGTRSPLELGVAAPDPRTLVITLKAPAPTLLAVLAHPVAFPVHRVTLETQGEAWTMPGHLLSTGAYRLAARQPGSHLLLLKNGHFHDAAKAAIDRVVYYPIPNRATELRHYQSGSLDVLAELAADQIAWAEANRARELWRKPFLGTYYYVFNLKSAPFQDNPRLRQALSLAVDREKLTREVIKTGDEPAYALIPPAMPNHARQTVAADLSPEQRLDMARKLFGEAGYGPDKPLSLTVLTNASPSHRRVAEAMIAQWREAFGAGSLTANLATQPWPAYTEARLRGDFQLARVAWIGDIADPTTFLDLFLSFDRGRNISGYANPRFDERMARSAHTLDPATRRKLLEEAERQLMTDLPLLPLYHYRTRYLVSPRVKGWEANPLDVHPSRFLTLGK